MALHRLLPHPGQWAERGALGLRQPANCRSRVTCAGCIPDVHTVQHSLRRVRVQPLSSFPPNLAVPRTAPPLSLQLPLSDKGLKKLSESFRFYKHALHDAEVRAGCSLLVLKFGCLFDCAALPAGLVGRRVAAEHGRLLYMHYSCCPWGVA